MSNRNIVIGVSGSIAAYKALLLTRLCQESGATVWPVLTRGASRFVSPLSFSALTGIRAVTDLWSASEGGEIGHVEWAHLAETVVLAPATADLIARLASGRANDPLTALTLATSAPIVIAPAMEDGMWHNAVTQENLDRLRDRGYHIVPPASGALASGREGVGRMAEPVVILDQIIQAVTPQDLIGRNILVTAGPTREAFDPVRFISNPSSGKMGYALASAAKRRGAKVTLVSGPTALPCPPGVERIGVTTTEELLTACQRNLADCDALIMAAAPADYRPAAPSKTKQKKQPGGGARTVELSPTPDVLMTLKARTANRIVVGFAAETHDLTRYATDKLKRKDLDLIVANDISRPDSGFGTDTNVVTIIDRDGVQSSLPSMNKREVAEKILDRVAGLSESRWPQSGEKPIDP